MAVVSCCQCIIFFFAVFCSAEVFINQPSERIVVRRVADSLLLNCTVSASSPTAVIEWYKNRKRLNASLEAASWFSYEISSVKTTDGGYYKCIGKYPNQTQPDEAGVFINIEGKPVIIDRGYDGKHVSSTTYPVIPASTVRLHCYATGSPEIKFKWLKDGIEVTSNLEPDRPNGLNLKLLAVRQQDSGYYTCEAKNTYGDVARSIHVLWLGPDPGLDPEVTAIQPVVKAYDGDANVTLSCRGENTKQIETSTTWYYNGSRLQDNQRISIQDEFVDQEITSKLTPKVITSLTLYNVTMDDTGEYRCVVKTDANKGNSSVFLNVIEKAGPTGSPRPTKNINVIIGVCVGIFLFLIIVIILILRHFKRKRKPAGPRPAVGPFIYNVFITYNSKDYPWVRTNLLPLFEQNNIHYCIHYRNFEIGIPYYENMVNSVYQSKVVIVVMSKHYMASSYCREELDYAIHRSVEEHGTSPLIIIRVDDIKKARIPRVLRHKTFLDYTSGVEQETWQRRLLEHIHAMEDDVNENHEDAIPGQDAIQAPREDALLLPREDAIQGPREDAIQGPREDAIQGPREDAIPGPREDAIPVPREDAIQGPREDAIPGPREDAIPVPRENAIPVPREGAIQGPREDAILGPHDDRQELMADH